MISESGSDVSLDEIARRAGVGSGTLYRHFPTRYALLVAAYSGAAEEYAAVGHRLLSARQDGGALREWLLFLITRIAECRGLAAAALGTAGESAALSCTFHEDLQEAADVLLTDAWEHKTARSDLTAAELLTLANAIAGACETDPQDAERFLDLAYSGLAPR